MLRWSVAGLYFAVVCKGENESWHFREKNLKWARHEVASDNTKQSNREREKMMEKWKKEGIGTNRRENEILKNTAGGDLGIIYAILTCFIGNFFKY